MVDRSSCLKTVIHVSTYWSSSDRYANIYSMFMHNIEGFKNIINTCTHSENIPSL